MKSRLARILDVQLPIVLGPFGGLSSIGLTAAVSELGGLGSFGLYGYTPDRIRKTMLALRWQTRAPFAVNLWLPAGVEPAPADLDFDRYASALAPFFAEVGLDLPARPDAFLPTFDDQIRAVLELAPPVISFVFGVPSGEIVDEAHSLGIMLIGSATTVDEAIALEAGGMDAVAVTGFEAAGHRVSFLLPAEQSLVGTIALVPQVVDAITLPVIAAGGIADRRGVAAAFALGADGVQVGTAFLATRQSAANDAHRQAIRETPANGTVLTTAMSGRLARGIPNRAVRLIEAGGTTAPFPAQNWLTGLFRAEASRRGLGELQSLWLGQAARLAVRSEADEVFAELAAGIPQPM